MSVFPSQEGHSSFDFFLIFFNDCAWQGHQFLSFSGFLLVGSFAAERADKLMSNKNEKCHVYTRVRTAVAVRYLTVNGALPYR